MQYLELICSGFEFVFLKQSKPRRKRCEEPCRWDFIFPPIATEFAHSPTPCHLGFSHRNTCDWLLKRDNGQWESDHTDFIRSISSLWNPSPYRAVYFSLRQWRAEWESLQWFWFFSPLIPFFLRRFWISLCHPPLCLQLLWETETQAGVEYQLFICLLYTTQAPRSSKVNYRAHPQPSPPLQHRSPCDRVFWQRTQSSTSPPPLCANQGWV